MLLSMSTSAGSSSKSSPYASKSKLNSSSSKLKFNSDKSVLTFFKELYPYVVYGCSIAKQIDVVALMSGPQAAFAFERALENLGQFTSTRQTINEKGTLGAIVLGEDITKPKSSMLPSKSGLNKPLFLEVAFTNIALLYKEN